MVSKEEIEKFIDNIKKIIYIYNNNIIMISNDLVNLIDSFDDKNTLIDLLNKKIHKKYKNGILQIFTISTSYTIKLEILKCFEKYIYFNRIDLLDIAISSVCGNIDNNIKEYIILNQNKNNFIIEI